MRMRAIKNLNANFLIKYSATKTFADRMLSISGDIVAKKLATPVEQDEDFKYEGK